MSFCLHSTWVDMSFTLSVLLFPYFALQSWRERSFVPKVPQLFWIFSFAPQIVAKSSVLQVCKVTLFPLSCHQSEVSREKLTILTLNHIYTPHECSGQQNIRGNRLRQGCSNINNDIQQSRQTYSFQSVVSSIQSSL